MVDALYLADTEATAWAEEYRDASGDGPSPPPIGLRT
jgi:hypothetical protein